MLTYSKASQKSIANAIAKAKKLKPRVKAVAFGHYEVAGSKGDSYKVSFSKDSAGEFVALCECQANAKRNMVCYHVASCAGHYKLSVIRRANERGQSLEAAAAQSLEAAAAVPSPIEHVAVEISPEQLAKDHADLFGF